MFGYPVGGPKPVRAKVLRIGGRFGPRSTRSIGGELFWILVGQALAALGSLVGVRILTGSLSPAVYGQFALGTTAALLSQQVILGPLTAAAMRFFAPAREHSYVGVYLDCVRRLVVISMAVLLVLGGLFWCGLVLTHETHWSALLVASLVVAALLGLESTLDSMQNAARQRRLVAWHDASGAWLRYVCAGGLVLAFHRSSVVAMYGFVVGTAIVLASQAYFFRKRIWRPAQLEDDLHQMDAEILLSRMWAYAWPFSTWGLFSWAQLVSDNWGLQAASGSRSVGLYFALYQIGYNPIALATNAVVQLLAPILFSRAGDGSDKERLNSARGVTASLALLAFLTTLAGGILALFARHAIFRYAVGPSFRSAANLLPPLVLAGGFFATAQICATYALARYDPRGLIVPKVVLGSIGALMNVLAAFRWGVGGVVYANLVFAGLYLIWVGLIAMRPSRAAAESR